MAHCTIEEAWHSSAQLPGQLKQLHLQHARLEARAAVAGVIRYVGERRGEGQQPAYAATGCLPLLLDASCRTAAGNLHIASRRHPHPHRFITRCMHSEPITARVSGYNGF